MVLQDAVTTFSSQTKKVLVISAYKVRWEDDGTYTYCCLAKPGTATSAAGWNIKRIKNSNNEVDWAGSDIKFTQIQENYASFSYG